MLIVKKLIPYYFVSYLANVSIVCKADYVIKSLIQASDFYYLSYFFLLFPSIELSCHLFLMPLFQLTENIIRN